MTPLAASARMYAVAPAATEAWARLLAHVGAQAGVPLAIAEHAFPAPLGALWSREDLGCAFMCGWPLALEDAARSGAALRPVIAAPVPDAAWSAGQAIYRSDFLVATGSRFRAVEDLVGYRFAYNAMSSHSGVNMPRAHLSRWAARAPLFSALVGPLTTPRRCIEAVRDGAADGTAIDSYALQLMVRHDPDLAGAVRVIGSSDPSPIPPLVGGPKLSEDARARLCAALTSLHADATGRALLAELCLSRFVSVPRATYEATRSVEAVARAQGYPVLV